MSDERNRRELQTLAMRHVEALGTWEQALPAIDVLALRDVMAEGRRDHRRALQHIARALAALGEEPPTEPAFRGLVMQGLAALRALAGATSALRVLRDDASLTLRAYAAALAEPWPEPLLAMIREHHEEAKRRLDLFEQVLADEPQWKAGRLPA
ncbi:MAG: hypothetical protein ACJ79L_04170 [Anaeromyxobacteraceae bacterium]